MIHEIENLIRTSWKENQSRYIDSAAEKVGIWVYDYEKHPDTGAILADTSYYSNEKEIEEKAKELFAMDFIQNNDLCGILDQNNILIILNEEE